MEIIKLRLAACHPNTGQIPGVPANPREWTGDDVARLADSIKETPELLEARPLLVYPVDGGFVVLGGNLRLTAARRLKMHYVPAVIFPAETTPEKLREIVIKDNGAFGNWDYDALANNWDDLPLGAWGVPAWDTDASEESEETPADGDEDNKLSITITFADKANLERFIAVYGDAIKEEYNATLKE